MTQQEYEKKIGLLNYYTELYDKGIPEISDFEWDNLYFECQQYEIESGYVSPRSPTSVVNYDVQNALKKVTHNHPMLSLDKTKDVAVIRQFVGGYKCVVMSKLDGLTLSLLYEDGKLVSAETRGNGENGEDVTHNAKVIPSIPQTINYKDRLVVDGEIICKIDDFQEYSTDYKNPRNFASGSIRLLDSSICAKRRLTFVAWDIIDDSMDFLDKLELIEKLGFICTPYEIVDIEHLVEQQDRLRKLFVTLNYPTDGLVYRINDQKIWLSKGKTPHHFNGSFAFKFYDEEHPTFLREIFWSVGKTGVITPVAVFDPVEIEGSTVQKASMHNLSIMHELLGEHPYAGQKIWVYKANLIIPQISRAEKYEELENEAI